MRYGYGRGFGFRGASPQWPYVGRGRGGLPRCWSPGLWNAPYTAPTFRAGPTPDEEMGFLRNETDVLKRQLDDIEHRIQELEKKE